MLCCQPTARLVDALMCNLRCCRDVEECFRCTAQLLSQGSAGRKKVELSQKRDNFLISHDDLTCGDRRESRTMLKLVEDRRQPSQFAQPTPRTSLKTSITILTLSPLLISHLVSNAASSFIVTKAPNPRIIDSTRNASLHHFTAGLSRQIRSCRSPHHPRRRSSTSTVGT